MTSKASVLTLKAYNSFIFIKILQKCINLEGISLYIAITKRNTGYRLNTTAIRISKGGMEINRAFVFMII
jgi:hypothetical protein